MNILRFRVQTRLKVKGIGTSGSGIMVKSKL